MNKTIFHKTKIYGYDFVNAENINNIVDFIFENLNNFDTKNEHLPIVLPINVDLLIKLENDFPDLKNKLKKSFLILPDGQPIVWSSRILSKNKPLKKRLAGSDLFPALWEKIKEKRIKTLIVAPSEKVKNALQKEYPEAKFLVPPYIFYPKEKNKFEEIIEEIYKIIVNYNIKIVLLGIGFPKQEITSIKISEKLKKNNLNLPIFVTLGASFEFYIGEKKRAPQFIQNIGLEWFYRFLQEPKRLFKRYFVDDIKFISFFFKELRKEERYDN